MAVLVTSKSWDPTASSACSDTYLLGDSPGTLAKDLIKIHGHGVGSNKTLDLCLLSRGQDPHDGLGCKPVLGSLLVVTLWHITKHDMSSLVDIMDNLAKVALEILGSKTLKVSKSCWRNVSLPLQVSFSSINKGSKGSIFSHEIRKGPSNLQISCRDRTFSTGRKSYSSFLVSLNSFPSSCGLLSHVSSKDNQVEIFLDVIHDLGLQEGLGSIVHDFIAELRFCNILSQLLDTVPPVFGVPFRSIILSALFFAPAPSLSLIKSSLTTSNSPLNRVSFSGSMTYLSVFRRDALIPGTVSIRPSNEAEIWNSLKRQAMTQPVVALERPTWSLTMTGVLIAVPTRVLTMMSKSDSRGDAELQTGTLQ